MAELRKAFDFSTVDIKDSFDPLPPNDYIIEMIDSEVRQTKVGDGEYMAARFRVCDGPYENRNFFINVTMESQNPVALSIGEKAMAQICAAVGLQKLLENTNELHNIPMLARLAIEEGKNGYPARNKVVWYKPATTSVSPAVAASAPAAAAKPAAPWKR